MSCSRCSTTIGGSASAGTSRIELVTLRVYRRAVRKPLRIGLLARNAFRTVRRADFALKE